MPSPTFAADAVTAQPPARAFVFVLLAYFAAQMLLRIATSDALELDEAEQVLWTQQLALGYGPQPPLYTWLQMALFRIFGVSVFALALLKNSLLACSYLFTFQAARRLLPLPLAALAAASMLLLPQIAWESQRDLTHSVLLTTMAALTLWMLVELLQRPRPIAYLGLGIAIAGGLLAKYSYAAFAAALWLAAMLAPATRKPLLSPWFLASLLVAALLFAPHGLWLLQHWPEATARTLDKLDPTAADAAWLAAGRGLLSLVRAVLGFLTPLWLVLLVLFGPSLWRGEQGRPAAPDSAFCALCLRYGLILLQLFLAMVLLGGATRFKDRWMQPFLFFAPLAFFACAPQLAGHPRLRTLRRLLAGLALLLLMAFGARVWIDVKRHSPGELNLPGRALAGALQAQGYDGRTVLAGDPILGAILHLQWPQARVEVMRSGRAASPTPAGPLLLITREQHPSFDDDPLPSLPQLAAAFGLPAPTAAAHELALPYRLAPAGEAPLRYRWALVP